MSMDTGEPTTTEISLTDDEDAEQWLARDEARGVTARGKSREDALKALNDAVARSVESGHEFEISSEDPFFAAPTFSSGRSDISENVDEHLSGAVYQDKLGSGEES